jgi:hypothetical protein
LAEKEREFGGELGSFRDVGTIREEVAAACSVSLQDAVFSTVCSVKKKAMLEIEV